MRGTATRSLVPAQGDHATRHRALRCGDPRRTRRLLTLAQTGPGATPRRRALEARSSKLEVRRQRARSGAESRRPRGGDREQRLEVRGLSAAPVSSARPAPCPAGREGPELGGQGTEGTHPARSQPPAATPRASQRPLNRPGGRLPTRAATPLMAIMTTASPRAPALLVFCHASRRRGTQSTMEQASRAARAVRQAARQAVRQAVRQSGSQASRQPGRQAARVVRHRRSQGGQASREPKRRGAPMDYAHGGGVPDRTRSRRRLRHPGPLLRPPKSP